MMLKCRCYAKDNSILDFSLFSYYLMYADPSRKLYDIVGFVHALNGESFS